MSDSTSISTAANNDGQEWELYKENAAPLERGRNVKTLMRAVSSTESEEERKMNEKTIRAHERLVRPSEKRAEQLATRHESGNHGEAVEDNEEGKKEDPLVHWLSYIKFYQDTYPSDTQQQFLLLERCTRSLLYVRRYANDIRFIRVCMLYADRTSCPGDIYKFLNKRKIGTETALFWVAWAWTAEKAGDFAFAEKIFAKGLSKGAKPKKMMKDRQKQFIRRMSRKCINNSRQHEEGFDEEEFEAAENRRGVLGGLTHEGSRTNHRSRGTSDRGGVSSTFMRRGNHGSSTCNDNNGVKPKGGFNIFVDENDENREDEFVEGGYVNHNQMLVKEKDRRKENEMKAERWNERGGLVHPSHQHEDGISTGYRSGTVGVSQPSFRNRGAPAPTTAHEPEPAPKIEIFVDDECAKKNEAEKDERDKKDRGRGGDGRSLRQRMDGSVADKLARDPLRYVRNPSKFTSDKQRNKEDKFETDQKHRSKTRKPTRNEGDENQQPATNQIHSKECNKIKSQQPPETRSGSGKGSWRLDKRLLARDSMGQECCFEQGRAIALQYTLLPPEQNFNLLKDKHLVEKQERALSRDDSAMDVDEDGSIDEVEMDDEFRRRDEQSDVDKINTHMKVEQLNASIMQAAGQDSCSKVSMSGRVLFDNSICDTSQQNLSTASSTLNERDAVGAPAEETINTKFARLEMSVMFSSPDKEEQEVGGFVEVGENSVESEQPLFSMHGGVQEEANCVQSANTIKEDQDGDTATLSIMADLMDNGNEAPTMTTYNATNENNENIASNNRFARKNRAAGFGGCALRTIDQGELDHDGAAHPKQTFAVAQDMTGQKQASGSNFQIFCDGAEENDGCTNDGEAGNQRALPSSTNFQIFCDEAEDDDNCSTDQPLSSNFQIFCDKAEEGNTHSDDEPLSTNFQIFCDEAEEGNGFSNVNLENHQRIQPLSTVAFQHAPDPQGGDDSAPFSIFCDEDRECVDEDQNGSDDGDTATLSLFGEAMKGVKAETDDMRRSKRKVAGRGGGSKFTTEKRKSILKSKPVQVKPKTAGFSIFCDDDTHDDMVR